MKKYILSILLIFFNMVIAQSVHDNLEHMISNGYNNSILPKIGVFDDGGFVVVWTELNDNSDCHGYFQLFDEFGNRKGNKIKVDEKLSFHVFTLDVAVLSDGNFVIAYPMAVSNSDRNVYAKKYSKDGNPVGRRRKLSSMTNAVQQVITVALNDKKYAVSFVDHDTFLQVYNSSNQQLFANDKIESANIYSGDDYSIDSKNDTLIICYREKNDSDSEIYAQIIGKSGEIIKEEFQVNKTTEKTQEWPSVTFLKNGHFVITWKGAGTTTNTWDEFAQLFDATGNKLGDEFIVHTNCSGTQWKGKTTELSNGTILFTWSDNKNIIARLYDDSCQPISNEYKINIIEGIHIDPCLESLSDNGFVICWHKSDGWKFTGEVLIRYFHGDLFHLNNFSLLSPSHDSSLNTTMPVFLWKNPSKINSESECAIKSDLLIDDNSNFSSPIIYSNIADTSHKVESLNEGKIYYWKVIAQNMWGETLESDQKDWGFFIKNGVYIDNSDDLINEYQLEQNYPNPFNPTTTIAYTIPKQSFVNLMIYDIKGNEIQTLINENKPAGRYTVNFNATEIPSGIYFYRLYVGNKLINSKKMMVLK